MKPELILQSDILDIIFEHRNKEYGAYNLRKTYNSRMMKAMCGVFGIVAALLSLHFVSFSSTKKSLGNADQKPDVVLTMVDVKEPELPKLPEQLRPRPATIQYTTPLIINQDVIEPIPEIKQLANVLDRCGNIGWSACHKYSAANRKFQRKF
jgi:periplasmic protein TonB